MKLFIGAVIVLWVGLGIVTALPVQPPVQPASAQQSVPICQYPDRWTNPPNGCDNSDPAVPECIKEFSTKEGEEACIARFVAAHEPVRVPETLEPMEGK